MSSCSRLAFVVIAALTSVPSIWAQGANPRSTSFDVPSGQEIRMDLSAGEYAIRGSAEEKVRVEWSSDDPPEAAKVKVRLTTERGRIKVETDHTQKTRVVISVPARSDLYIRLSAGELSVTGIEGHKNIGLTAGELRVEVGDPASYSDVRSSVRIGEISAQPFRVSKSGFFRGFKAAQNGKYSLRATVGIGEVTLAQ